MESGESVLGYVIALLEGNPSEWIVDGRYDNFLKHPSGVRLEYSEVFIYHRWRVTEPAHFSFGWFQHRRLLRAIDDMKARKIKAAILEKKG